MLTIQEFFQLERTAQVQYIQRKSLTFQVGNENGEELGMEKSDKLTEGSGSQGKVIDFQFLATFKNTLLGDCRGAE